MINKSKIIIIMKSMSQLNSPKLTTCYLAGKSSYLFEVYTYTRKEKVHPNGLPPPEIDVVHQKSPTAGLKLFVLQSNIAHL